MISFILVIAPRTRISCFCVLFYFQGSIHGQMDLEFFEDQYFPKIDDTNLRNHANGVGKKERARVARAPTQVAQPPLFCPSVVRNCPSKARDERS
jgi:hypothetical protein